MQFECRYRVRPLLRWLSAAVLLPGLLAGCASAGGPRYADHDLRSQGSFKISMPAEYQEEVENLDKLNASLGEQVEGGERIVATSVALCQIMEALDINLVGRPITHLGKLPERYASIKAIGMPMNPDMERIYQLKPSVVYAPDSLKDWLEEGFRKHKLPIEFVNLKSVEGLYEAVQTIGTRFHKEAQVAKLLAERDKFFAQVESQKQKRPFKVLLLMGLPGSYVVATPNSYIGNLLELSGGQNVFSADRGQEFINANTEAMLQQDPDLILRAVHAMPDTVQEMFRKAFAEDPIWKHFRAVKEGRVFDLNPDCFGMSALFNYQQALQDLQDIYAQAAEGGH